MANSAARLTAAIWAADPARAVSKFEAPPGTTVDENGQLNLAGVNVVDAVVSRLSFAMETEVAAMRSARARCQLSEVAVLDSIEKTRTMEPPPRAPDDKAYSVHVQVFDVSLPRSVEVRVLPTSTLLDALMSATKPLGYTALGEEYRYESAGSVLDFETVLFDAGVYEGGLLMVYRTS